MANTEMLFVPIGGMNQDDSFINPSKEGVSAFEQGSYRYALNFRTGTSRNGSNGDGENIKSTLEIVLYKTWNGSAWVDGTKPSGTNVPRGQCEDRQLRKIFFANYNSSGNHTICEYRPQEKAVYELLRWSGLNFQGKFISMSRVGGFLVFTDKYNKPRIIDYTTIHVLKNTLGSSFCEFHISFSKWAPVAPPVVTYAEAIIGPTLNKSLEKLIVQFTYRYWYVGGFYSAWSPVSNTASNLYLNGPIGEMILTIPGLIYDSNNINTPIKHNDPSFLKVVEFIEIAYRGNQLDTWKSYSKNPINQTPISTGFPGTGNDVFNFTGKATGVPISPDVISQDYDEVPIKSACVEVIDSRVLFGNNLEEHTFVNDTDFIENVAIYSSRQLAWFSHINVFTILSAVPKSYLLGKNRLSQQTLKSRGIYKFSLEFKDETGKKSLTYTTDQWIATIPDNSPSSAYIEPYFAVGWNFKAGFKPPDWATSYQILRTNCLNIEYFLFGHINKFQLLVDDTSTIADNVTNPIDIRKVMNEFFDSDDKSAYSLSKRLGAEIRKTKVITTLANASRIYIDINNWYNAAKNTGSDINFPMNKLYYEYQQGDRVRFFGSSASATPSAGQIIVYDVPIIEFTGRGIIIEKPVGILWVPGTSETPDKFVIEVYRPRKQINAKDLIYYETGEWYPVTNPKTESRDFLKRDWRWDGVDNVTSSEYNGHYGYNKLPFYAGDCHTVKRNYYYDYVSGTRPGFLNDVYGPSMNPNKEETFGEWEKNNGRPNTAYINKPLVQFKESAIRFGGKYLQDAVFNNINNCRPLDQFLYPQEYGAICEMVNTTSYQVESVGSILLVLSSIKSFSVYVNRTTLEDLGGRTQYFLSEKVLGSYNSLLGDYGCINPESLSFSNKGNVYWWDQFAGAWIRYGRDGNTPVSEVYKMDSWFKEIQALLDDLYTEESQPWIISIFDNRQKELITFIEHASLPATLRGYDNYKGMVFNEESNEWKFAHNYNPDLFSKINNQVIGFKNGKYYILEGGTDYSTFFGTKYDVKVEPVFSEFPRQNKSWQDIAEISTHAWSIERTLSEYYGAKDEQTSSLLLNKLTPKENAFYSELMNASNSPSQPDAAIAVGAGDKIRSRILRVMLKLDPSVTTRSLLHQIVIGFLGSGKNVKG